MEKIDLSKTFGILSAAGADSNGGDMSNINARGLKVIVDITAISGTSATLTVSIKGKDAISGKYYTLLTSAGLQSTGTTVLTVYPGLTPAANTIASDVLPGLFEVSWTITGTAPSVTGTIGGSLLV